MTQHNQEFTDFITKKTYRVPESQLKISQLYRSRYVLGIALAIFLWQFDVFLPLAIALGLGFIGVSEFRYRTHFLKIIPVVKKPTQKEASLTKSTLILNGVLYLTLAGVLVVYVRTTDTLQNPFIVYIISTCSAGIGLFYAYKYFTSRK